jgi:phytoene/squalene synthetase
MSAPDPAAAVTAATGEPWRDSVAWGLLDRAAQDDLGVLFRFVAAVRAVADHPALAADRKEAALAALAAPFGDDPTASSSSWSAPAIALADLLRARGMDGRAAWRILQAAGQDLRKSRYRDWSDLLTWCRFSAAPVGALGASLLGIDAAAAKKAEALAIAWQVKEIVARAPSHYRWLGRVYLPERWFTEAQGEIGDLGFQRLSPPLRKVLARALEQVCALADEAEGISAAFSSWRRRAALHAAMIELMGETDALAKISEAVRPQSASGWRRRLIRIKAVLSALLARR